MQVWAYPVTAARVAAKNPYLARLCRYRQNYWGGLKLLCLIDGRSEIDNNTVECETIPPMLLNRKKCAFAGHRCGAEKLRDMPVLS